VSVDSVERDSVASSIDWKALDLIVRIGRALPLGRVRNILIKATIMRLLPYVLVRGKSAPVSYHSPSRPRTSSVQTGMYRHLRRVTGIYTGRTIFVPEAQFREHLNELKKSGSQWYSDAPDEKWLMNYVEGELVDLTKMAALRGCKVTSEFWKTLVEEYVHWEICRGTTLAMYIDVCSWWIRLSAMFLTERFYVASGVSRDSANISTMSRAAFSNDVCHDEIAVFAGMISHFRSLYHDYAEPLVSLVEPVTWVILEEPLGEDPESRIADYATTEYERGILADHVRLARRYLEENGTASGRQQAVRGLISIASQALRIPIEEIERLRKEGGADLVRLASGRFRELLNTPQQQAGRMPLFRDVIAYFLCNKTRDARPVAELSVELLSQESDVIEYIMREIRYTQGLAIYRFPTIYMGYKGSFLWYDPWSRLEEMRLVRVNRTQRRFRTWEDLVGDLPLLHRLVLKLIYGLSDTKEMAFSEENLKGMRRLAIPVDGSVDHDTEATVESTLYTHYSEIVELAREAERCGGSPESSECLARYYSRYKRLWIGMALSLRGYVKSILDVHGLY
jgi:hypothetical protein